MTEDQATSDSSSRGPICPNCREPLRSNLRYEQVVPQGQGQGPEAEIALTYCGACGWTLQCIPVRIGGPAGRGRRPQEEVAAPADEQTLEGQFQLRCRELIGEIRSLGFDPHVWVAMTNGLGAAGAARKLLADHHELAATHWLVTQGRPELTMEHAIALPRWAELFTEADRAEAAQRLAHTGSTPRK